MKKTVNKNYPNPIIWKANTRTVHLVNNGDTTIPNNKLLRAGTLLNIPGEIINRYGKIYETVSSNTNVKLFKDHNFAVGNDLVVDASNSGTILSITEYDDYDLIVLDTAISATINRIVYNTLNNATGTADVSIVAIDTILEDIDANANYSITITDFCIIDIEKSQYGGQLKSDCRNYVRTSLYP